MVTTYELKNSTYLFIVNRLSVFSFLSSENLDFPKCIFQLNDNSLIESEFTEIIKLLLKRNCELVSFFCVNAEHYHDLADIFLEGFENGEEIMTTYHDDESGDDVANFVVNGISTISSERLLLITEDDVKDSIKNALLKL
ncbi:hypothetical protein [Pseudoalteromonas carrageenovora]|uniref:hypothetical protein n=1 Tax=Pseudoalteromonas carrageenovora TaxID=227 RepID=UPI0026E12EDB|nr:hypothetical protein [Pseudoalteromonas carrageenovora]MDO6464455.1 hypothetical protein [Pseudoalteromonas carrageenovora]